MPETQRPKGRSRHRRDDDMPQTLWQFLGYALRLVVDKVLGDWSRTLLLWLLGVLPILLVFGTAALVVGVVHPGPRGWGIVVGAIVAAATGTPVTRGVVRYVRGRRQRHLSRTGMPPPGDGTPTREGG
jgi:hypothetical protein